jgi:CO/xanthine dehydrogenase FAD-binding subunit
MKPAPFRYFAPTTLDEALALLVEHGGDGKVIAGGQSLVPTMNFRLAQPTVLIDLNNIAELSYIRPAADGGLRIGAMTRQRTVERDRLVAERAPLLHETMPYIAHTQIRNRGTIGGSLAHADPAAELPAVALALNAQLRVQSQTGERWIAAQDFYLSLFTTALASDELLVEIALPAPVARAGWSVQEVARRHGDYAIVGVTAQVTLDEQGRCTEARLALLSVGDGPVLAQQAGQLLLGERPTQAVIEAAAETCATTDIEPTADIHASVAYRRHLARVLTQRALTQAFALAQRPN